jgi:hypothetical protein
MLVGDRVKYSHSEEVVILKIEGNYALIQFDSGTKICNNLHGLKKIPQVCIVERQGGCIKNDPEADLTGSYRGTVSTKI